MFRESSGYTGRMMEDEFLKRPKLDGAIKPEHLIEQDKKKIAGIHAALEHDGFLPYDQAMRILKLIQPYEDPSNPDSQFSKDLMNMIAEKLGLKEENRDKIKIYTAVGSPLDHKHGIDAFITFDDDDLGEIIVTLDLTKNSNKDYTKADVLLDIPEAFLISKDENYLAACMDEYADRIVEFLVNKINEKEGN